MMQTNLFGNTQRLTETIEKAAATANVSSATIRNWIKTGYLKQVTKGSITKESLDNFMLHIAGKEKLNARANKQLKDNHDHKILSNEINLLIQKFSGDAIGNEYEKCLSDSYRNKEGIYYTPSWVVKDMLKGIKISNEFTFLDPCCGSGNFLIEAIKLGIRPENVYGFDIDDNAVLIAKERIKQECGFETLNIKQGDFLQEALNLKQENLHFNFIFTNPPWGKKINKTEKKQFASIYSCGNSIDTTSLFMAASLNILEKGGLLGFLVQEAFFNITVFEDIRKKIIAKQILRFIDYGKAFKGLVTKAQGLVIENAEQYDEKKIECSSTTSTFFRSLYSFKNNPKTIFNFSTTEDEAQVIDRLFAIKHITLKGQANWALGIVTGNNEQYCSTTKKEGYVPIYKGSDVTTSGLKEPTTFILDDFSNFQQVAPLGMYHAKEKLIYKFISSDLCFYCDTQQKYILNSANLLIPVNLNITCKQLASLLNSKIINWLFKNYFQRIKFCEGT